MRQMSIDKTKNTTRMQITEDFIDISKLIKFIQSMKATR